MKYFIADTHFNHELMARKRSFSSVEEMNNVLINNWNETISNSDIVYVAGDFSFGDPVPILKKLNGQKFLAIGDHDKSSMKLDKYFIKISIHLLVKEQGQLIIVSHWPYWLWPKSHYDSWQVHGHTHDKMTPRGKSYNVGVDTNNLYPTSFEKIKAIMSEKPDNINLLRNRLVEMKHEAV